MIEEATRNRAPLKHNPLITLLRVLLYIPLQIVFLPFALIGLIIALESFFVSPFAVGFAVFINLLEILVAFIQAYIFTMLSSLFIGMAMHPQH